MVATGTPCNVVIKIIGASNAEVTATVPTHHFLVPGDCTFTIAHEMEEISDQFKVDSVNEDFKRKKWKQNKFITPNIRQCPKCDGYGYVREDGLIICEDCGFDFDINEDFICGRCGNKTPGRYLFCSPECEELGVKEEENEECQ